MAIEINLTTDEAGIALRRKVSELKDTFDIYMKRKGVSNYNFKDSNFSVNQKTLSNKSYVAIKNLVAAVNTPSVLDNDSFKRYEATYTRIFTEELPTLKKALGILSIVGVFVISGALSWINARLHQEKFEI